MLITAAPVAIPVTTANPSTEAVANEAAHKTPIPKAPATSDNPNTRHSADSNEPPRTPLDANKTAVAHQRVDDGSEKQQNQQQQQRRREQQQQTEQLQEIEGLRRRDREVRAHEAAHASVGGQLAGAPRLSFATGPDGKRYAVSGEVSIDTARVPNDPQATIQKMNQVQRAALAPANPSNQDMKVAAIASQVANQALVQLNIERTREASKTGATPESQASRGSIRFANPIAARRSSLQLHNKLERYGVFEDPNREPLFSQNA